MRKTQNTGILGTICARGGSKGLPKKNVRLLCGKPLVAHTIETALQCEMLERVIVSTDDPEIKEIALHYGAEVPFLRPSDLAADKISKWPVLRHLVTTLKEIDNYRCQVVVDLDPTAPLRDVSDITNCLTMFEKGQADVIFSVCEAYKNPYFNMVEYHGDVLRLCKVSENTITCRQDAPSVLAMNASIYVFRTSYLMEKDGLFSGKTGGYIMPPERSVDIDREIDFEFVEYLMNRERLVRKES